MLHRFPMCVVVSRSRPFTTGSCGPQHFYASLPVLHGFPKGPCPILLCGYCFHVSLSSADRGAEAKALAGGRRCSLDWVSPNRPGETGRVALAWKGHRGKAETGTKTETESMGSTDMAGPAWFRGTGLGSGLWLRTIKVPPWETRLQWGFGWGAPTPK